MHLVGFNTQIYHDARSHERQIMLVYLYGRTLNEVCSDLLVF